MRIPCSSTINARCSFYCGLLNIIFLYVEYERFEFGANICFRILDCSLLHVGFFFALFVLILDRDAGDKGNLLHRRRIHSSEKLGHLLPTRLGQRDR